MTKTYITIKDPHFRFGLNRPIGRDESFETDIISKIDEIITIAQHVDCYDVICTGDLFDIKAPSLYDLKVLKANETVLNKFKAAGITLHSIAGNHDLPSSSIDRKHDSVYQYFAQHNIINDIEAHKTEELCGYDYRTTTTELLDHLSTDELSTIVVVHEHVFPDDVTVPAGFDNHITYTQLITTLKRNKRSKCKVVVCGHLHKGYPLQEIDGILIINQWNLTRLARTEYALNNDHKPEIVIFEIDNGQLTDYTTHTLHSRSPEQCFVQKEIERNLQLDVNIKSFISQVTSFNNETNITEQLNITDNKVKELVQHYIERATNGK